VAARARQLRNNLPFRDWLSEASNTAALLRTDRLRLAQEKVPRRRRALRLVRTEAAARPCG
jgi:hypothetical protein